MNTGSAIGKGYSDAVVRVERLSEQDRYSLLMGSQVAGQEPLGATFELCETADLLYERYREALEILEAALPTEELKYALSCLMCGVTHYAQARGAELQSWFYSQGQDLAAAKVAMAEAMK